MATKKIMVTGADGQLGNELKELAAAYPDYDFLFFNSAGFPVDDEGIAKNLLGENRPGFLINCAAYTAVDKAESETERAEEVNGRSVGRLALLCHQVNTKFLHISTDYVFNGKQSTPLKETDVVDPVNAYGASKLLGEQLAVRNPDTVIIRTSWVYSSYGKNFVKTMMRLMREKESIQVVSDQFGSPTYAADLAAAIMQIVSAPKWIPGIYHFSNKGRISWFDFAVEIKNLIGASCKVWPIATEQYPTPAKRPMYSVLDTTKIQETYHIETKEWKESLRICIGKMLLADSH
jgi:dTDP-4-dehydrorhamnose reductase